MSEHIDKRRKIILIHALAWIGYTAYEILVLYMSQGRANFWESVFNLASYILFFYSNAVVLLPYHDSWQSLFESLDQFSDDFMEQRDQPTQPSRESAFE